MEQRWLLATSADGGCQFTWEDGERLGRREWRLDDNGKRRAVLVVLPAAENPSRSSPDRLIHEYGLKDQFDGAWAVPPLDLARDAGRTRLVLEEVGGESSKGCSARPWRSNAC